MSAALHKSANAPLMTSAHTPTPPRKSAAAWLAETGGSGLSAQFRPIVAKAGIVGRVVTRQGKGRATNSKTFHGLRHSFISQLANAGVAPEIRQKLAGHASAEVHGLYTHHEIETLRAAVEKLPGLRNA